MGWVIISLIIMTGLTIYPIISRANDQIQLIKDIPGVEIIWIHVPMAWGSSLLIMMIGVGGIGYIVTRIEKIVEWSRSIGIIGLIETLITIISGSIWGKVTWGTYWEWDPRLTTEAIVLLIYITYVKVTTPLPILIGYNGLSYNVIGIKGSIVGIIGLVIIPIIKKTVEWWSTIHQTESIRMVSEEGGSGIGIRMMIPMILNSVLNLILVIKIGEEMVRENRLRKVLSNLNDHLLNK